MGEGSVRLIKIKETNDCRNCEWMSAPFEHPLCFMFNEFVPDHKPCPQCPNGSGEVQKEIAEIIKILTNAAKTGRRLRGLTEYEGIVPLIETALFRLGVKF